MRLLRAGFVEETSDTHPRDKSLCETIGFRRISPVGSIVTGRLSKSKSRGITVNGIYVNRAGKNQLTGDIDILLFPSIKFIL